MRFAVVLLAFLVGAISARAEERTPLPPQPAGVGWPTVAWPTGTPDLEADTAALPAAADRLFTTRGRGGLLDTRALLVIQKGSLVFERYAPEFGAESRFHSWSMAKTVTQAMIGILVRDGRLAVDDRAPVEAWAETDDPRRGLTLRHLLHMSTGIDNADGGDDGLVGHLLFGEGSADVAGLAAAHPLTHDPGTHWAYSTATSSILGKIITDAVGPGRERTRAWVVRELLGPLGMSSLVMEFDASEQLIGGSHMWATARDWARFGLLVLRDGLWEGQEILPRGWIDFSRTAAPTENNGNFGAHLWLNREPGPTQFAKALPTVSESAFMATGNAGQYVIAVPTKDLVVVRLGEMEGTSWGRVGPQLGDLIQLFPDLPQAAPGNDGEPSS